MILKITKFTIKTYTDLFKERSMKLVRDLILLVFVIFAMYRIELLTKGKSVLLFEVSYRLDMLLFYILGFIFILTTSVLFIDVRNLMNIISRFVITRFPNMQGEFGPGKMIFRDLVHVVAMILIFYPISGLLQQYNIVIFSNEIQLVYVVSLSFLVLTLLFVYDILIQVARIVASHSVKLTKLLKIDEELQQAAV